MLECSVVDEGHYGEMRGDSGRRQCCLIFSV